MKGGDWGGRSDGEFQITIVPLEGQILLLRPGWRGLIIVAVRFIGLDGRAACRFPVAGGVGAVLFAFGLGLGGLQAQPDSAVNRSHSIGYKTPVDPGLQAGLERIDERLREPLGMALEHVAVGLMDLRSGRLALIHPDRAEYAASVPKVGILLAWFERHPHWADELDTQTRHELGLMTKVSDNAMATRFSRELGLKEIQAVLDAYGFYDPERGGGLWMGKHYAAGDERYGDPVNDHSHSATVRQVMRYFLMLEQGELVSPEASQAMREIFASPEIPHTPRMFVKALEGRGVEILRKWGSWREWKHDAAVIHGDGRHYILVALTRHAQGEPYLEELAAAVDDWMGGMAGGDR